MWHIGKWGVKYRFYTTSLQNLISKKKIHTHALFISITLAKSFGFQSKKLINVSLKNSIFTV